MLFLRGIVVGDYSATDTSLQHSFFFLLATPPASLFIFSFVTLLFLPALSSSFFYFFPFALTCRCSIPLASEIVFFFIFAHSIWIPHERLPGQVPAT
ncbi:hypothetical protein L1987_42982 [Smallanthus sonchifolius]|uniref:Uncharacterized protein n=1 Tax=Smallanthus sonchifolius TaxID=185202 RepID=A0ACB9GK52_9ASTR|nr:hypothetical protein L1987_42982 [Smallanthus sonchifolius]